MNKRIIEIINIIKNENTSLVDLETRFGVSNRTIRNDINSINEMLEERGLNPLKITQGGKIEKDTNFEEVLNTIKIDNLYTYKLSKNERIDLIICMLINELDFITMQNIADHLYLSRQTIVNDLDDIKDILSKNSLLLETHKSRGIRINGEENFKRRLILSVILKKQNKNIVKYILKSNNDVEKIKKIIIEQENSHNTFLDDDSFERVCMYIDIMLHRNRQGQFVNKIATIENDKYIMAQDILKYVCQYFNIKVTEDEVILLKYILITSRYVKREDIDQDTVKVQFITRKFIDKMSEKLFLNLSDDYIFFENLSNHLCSVITEDPPEYRPNDVVEDIVLQNQKIFDTVLDNIDTINCHVKRKIKNEEINYIVVHICAALERRKNHDITLNVIIACNCGIGTSRLLIEKLKSHFSFNIVDVVSSREVGAMIKNKADLIISTIPLDNQVIKHIVVSPLFSDEDYIKVSIEVDKVKSTRSVFDRSNISDLGTKNIINEIMPLIRKIVPNQADEIESTIKTALNIKEHNDYDVKKDIFSPTLHNLLKEEHIKFDVECENWIDAIVQSAKILQEKNYIEESYLNAMIGNVEKNGPYIVISKGFAVPHACVEDGSIKLGMSLIRLKKPIPFGLEELDPVEFVCTVSPIDKKSHLKAFFNLVNMLQNDGFKENLCKTKTPKELINLIGEYEKYQ